MRSPPDGQISLAGTALAPILQEWRWKTALSPHRRSNRYAPIREGAALSNGVRATDWTAYHTPECVRRQSVPAALEWSPLLDSPTGSAPILNALMDAALTSIMLVSDGAVMALKIRTTGSREAHEPFGDLAAIIDKLGERYMACKTHRQRLMVIKDAQEAGHQMRHAPRAEIRGTAEWKEAIGRDARPCRAVAKHYRMSLRDVVAYRKLVSVTKVGS